MIYSNFSFPNQPVNPLLHSTDIGFLGRWELTKNLDREVVNYDNIKAAVAKRPLAKKFVIDMEGWTPGEEHLSVIKKWMAGVRAISGRPVAFWNARRSAENAISQWPDSFFYMSDFHIYGLYLYATNPSMVDWFERNVPLVDAMRRETNDRKEVILTVSPIIFGREGRPPTLISVPGEFRSMLTWALDTGRSVCIWAAQSVTSVFPWDNEWQWYRELLEVTGEYEI